MHTSSEPQDCKIPSSPRLLGMLEWSLNGHCMFALITPLGTSQVDKKPWVEDISNYINIYRTNHIQVLNLH